MMPASTKSTYTAMAALVALITFSKLLRIATARVAANLSRLTFKHASSACPAFVGP
jgi:hypothetical protein